VGTILGSVNFITTILTMRTPGMTMFRMLVFTWSVLVTSFMVLVAFPILAVALLIWEADRSLGAHVFVAANGGPILWQHLFWFQRRLHQPQPGLLGRRTDEGWSTTGRTAAKGMVTNVAMVEGLDEDGLWNLSQRTDNLGVLSVYVNADPTQSPNMQGVAIDLKNRFRELQRRIVEDGGSHQARDISAALERLFPQVENLADPTAPGRGRIAFAALGSDWNLRLESALPVANRVVLDHGPFIHPLLELLDEGRAAGVLLVSAEEARLLEWQLGLLQMLSRMEPEYVEAPHERAGQIGGGPQGQFHTPMREQRQARERDRMHRFLDRVTKAAADIAVARGWERILVSGGERWTEPTAARLPQSLHDKVFRDPRVLNGLDDTALAGAVTERVHDEHVERERQLLERVYEAGRAGAGALGLSEVAAALNVGRVEHLVYDPAVRYTGTVGADGALYAGDEVGPEGQPGTPEPRLTERLVERALETKARISPIEGAADEGLKDADGIAALLRW
jgi:hypothetical protein